MKAGLLRTNFELYKAELRKVWSFPIFELAIALIALISITTIPTLQKIIEETSVGTAINLSVSSALTSTLSSQMLPLGLLCGILVSLSFARDYEQGLMQSLLSLPVSRSSLYILKFFAVVIPLSLMSWLLATAVIGINFYSNLSAMLTVIQLTTIALPILLLALTFYGGLAVLIALIIRRTIPSALSVMIIGFSVWFITTLNADTIGNLANYLCLTPFKAPLISLGRLLGSTYPPNTLESTLPAWSFITLTIVYALVLIIPMYAYFTRRFEVRE
ncbi:MAG: ABC transporter permease subunit [Candidatus Bathyarchaeia archaeon]|jgi:ABC-type transport system involved in multi-copper enzyme maturation permease subunit